MESPQSPKPAILHICSRETLRPLRDQILRISGYEVDSTLSHTDTIEILGRRLYDLVLIDVEGDSGIHAAEALCASIKTARPTQFVVFVCNWRVAVLTDCPDDIVRSEFDPRAFVEGVKDILPPPAP